MLRPMLLGGVHKAVGLQAWIETEPKRRYQHRDIKHGLVQGIEGRDLGGARAEVFGAPTFFVYDEMFWVKDHLHFAQATIDND
jgi:2-hydroxychromene-2-carboxylate isomerase